MMRTYTFEDLYADHNVNALARAYYDAGALAAHDEEGMSLDDWWQWNGTYETLQPLTGYRNRSDVLACSTGVERFAWMSFREGWMTAKREQINHG